MKNKSKLFSIILLVIPLGLCLFFAWQLSVVKQKVNNVQAQVKLISQVESTPITLPTKLSNNQVVALQDQISKIQDFEDRRYNAITTQLNSFWSGVNGFLALIGIFFAMFSWYLVKQVESATKNIDILEEQKKDIGDYIAKNSFELYERTIKQDISQIIQSVKDSKNQELITSAYDVLKLRINYIEMNTLTDLYDSFSSGSVQLKQDRPSFYYKYLSYYLVLMLFKDYKKIPDDLIQEVIDLLIKPHHGVEIIQSFILLNNLCNANQLIGKKLGERTSAVIKLNELRKKMLDDQTNDINHILTHWFGLQIDNGVE